MEHFIPLDQAIEMTTRYRENRETILLDQYKGSDILPIAETFDRAAFDQVLSQPDCQKIRIYGGMDEEQKVHAIIVGVDANDRDILPGTAASPTTDTATSSQTDTGDGNNEEEGDGNSIVEAGQRCPPFCADSPLNP